MYVLCLTHAMFSKSVAFDFYRLEQKIDCGFYSNIIILIKYQ